MWSGAGRARKGAVLPDDRGARSRWGRNAEDCTGAQPRGLPHLGRCEPFAPSPSAQRGLDTGPTPHASIFPRWPSEWDRQALRAAGPPRPGQRRVCPPVFASAPLGSGQQQWASQNPATPFPVGKTKAQADEGFAQRCQGVSSQSLCSGPWGAPTSPAATPFLPEAPPEGLLFRHSALRSPSEQTGIHHTQGLCRPS